MDLEKFTRRLIAAAPEIRSIILYGSAAEGDYSPKSSDYNLLVVVDNVDLDLLDRIAPLVRRWMAAGNPPPLIFTPERLRASADVFPIEIGDMKQAHRLLYGEEMLDDLPIRSEDLRLQLERELKQKVIALRQGYLAAAGRRRALRRIMFGSIASVLTLMRAALRLYRAAIPLRKLDAGHMLSEYVAYDYGALETIYRWKRGEISAGNLDCRQLYQRYLSAVQTVADAVDRMVRESQEA